MLLVANYESTEISNSNLGTEQDISPLRTLQTWGPQDMSVKVGV